MSLSDVFRDRHYEAGYVYIAGSLTHRVIKIGVTKSIWSYERYLRNRKYGGIRDWVLLYYVWVNEGGRIEHEARRRLQNYKIMKDYEKDGSLQRAREIVRCTFSAALKALIHCISEDERSSAWLSIRNDEFEFDRPRTAKGRFDALFHLVSDHPETVQKILLKKIDQFEFSVRTSNGLKQFNITYVAELVQKTESQLAQIPNFGIRSLNEIKQFLDQMGLSLGTSFSQASD